MFKINNLRYFKLTNSKSVFYDLQGLNYCCNYVMLELIAIPPQN